MSYKNSIVFSLDIFGHFFLGFFVLCTGLIASSIIHAFLYFLASIIIFIQAIRLIFPDEYLEQE